MARFVLIALVLTGCGLFGGKEEDEDSGRPALDDTADTAGDGGDDSGIDTAAGIANYLDFVDQHARAYCQALQACGFLSERYANLQECVDDVTNQLSTAECPDFNRSLAEQCVAQDEELATTCSNAGEPPACRDVCRPPPEE